MSNTEAPVRLCCFERHYGVQCPDGKVMCELCFDRFEVSDLNVTEDGNPENVCKPCHEHDMTMFRRKQFREKLRSLTLIPPRHAD